MSLLAGVFICAGFRAEAQVFKSKFDAWDDVLAVDFTRTSSDVSRRGADMKVCWQWSSVPREIISSRKFFNKTKWKPIWLLCSRTVRFGSLVMKLKNPWKNGISSCFNPSPCSSTRTRNSWNYRTMNEVKSHFRCIFIWRCSFRTILFSGFLLIRCSLFITERRREHG